MLRGLCRRSDVAGRLGGEEFGVLLPETKSHGPQELARRIVEMCRSLTIATLAGPVKFSCSIGVTEATRGDETLEDVLRRADLALYEAKRTGRDRWVSIPSAPAALPISSDPRLA